MKKVLFRRATSFLGVVALSAIAGAAHAESPIDKGAVVTLVQLRLEAERPRVKTPVAQTDVGNTIIALITGTAETVPDAIYVCNAAYNDVDKDAVETDPVCTLSYFTQTWFDAHPEIHDEYPFAMEE